MTNHKAQKEKENFAFFSTFKWQGNRYTRQLCSLVLSLKRTLIKMKKSARTKCKRDNVKRKTFDTDDNWASRKMFEFFPSFSKSEKHIYQLHHTHTHRDQVGGLTFIICISMIMPSTERGNNEGLRRYSICALLHRWELCSFWKEVELITICLW